MTFGLDFFNSSGNLRWGAEEFSMPCIDVWQWVIGDSNVKSYPALTGATIRCEVSPSTWAAAITYPGGVPTITLSTNGFGLWEGHVTVFLVSLPTSLETQFSYRILNADGTWAVSPLNTILEYVGSASTSAASATADECASYSQMFGAPATYSCTVPKSTYPDAPFVMIDLPTHPYFGGVMDIQDNLGTDTTNWTIRVSGDFASAPTVYLFRRKAVDAGPSSGMGMAIYDESENCVFSTSDNLLCFTGPPVTPPIYEFNVPANGAGSVTIGNLDQYWTPGVALPTNPLIWLQSKQITCTEQCYAPGKGVPQERVIRQWNSGIARYSSTALMLRLKTITSFTRDPYASGTELFYGDHTVGSAISYVGSLLVADKDRVV